MSDKYIQDLLDKYYEGESSLDEEKELEQWLNNNDTNGQYMAEKAQFVFFKKQRQRLRTIEIIKRKSTSHINDRKI